MILKHIAWFFKDILPCFLYLLFSILHMPTNHHRRNGFSFEKKEKPHCVLIPIPSPHSSETCTLNHFYYPTDFMSPGHLYQLLGPLIVKAQLPPYNISLQIRTFFAHPPLKPNFQH